MSFQSENHVFHNASLDTNNGSVHVTVFTGGALLFSVGLICSFLGVFGNLGLLLVIIINKKARKTNSVFTANLAVCDLLLSTTVTLPHAIYFLIGRRYMSPWLCKMHTIIWSHLALIVLLHVTTVSIYRCAAVRFTDAYRKLRTPRYMIGAVVLLHALPIFMNDIPKIRSLENIQFRGSVGLCVEVQSLGASFIINVLALLISLFVLSYSFYQINKKLKIVPGGTSTTAGTISENIQPISTTSSRRSFYHRRVLMGVSVIWLSVVVGYIPLIILIFTARIHFALTGIELVQNFDSITFPMLCFWLSGSTNWLPQVMFDRDIRQAILYKWRTSLYPSKIQDVSFTNSRPGN